MIHDALSNWHIYFHANPWKQAFEFLSSLTPDSPVSNRIDLEGEDMYGAIMAYQTCFPQDAELEAHDKYIDIQVSLSNSEAIEWFPRNGLSVITPYDSDRDRILYHRPGQSPGRVCNFPGFFTVLFPDDAHMPKLITASKPEIVKKAVVKLNISNLSKS